MAAACTASHSGESHAIQSAILYPFNQYDGTYSFGGLVESHLNSLPSIHGGNWSCVPDLVLPDDMVDLKSVVSVKHCDSSGAVGY